MNSENNKFGVSVIMPAFNAEKFIKESIESVIAQTYSDWELIVVDDGSTDKTAEVVKGISGADNRIQYLYQPNSRQGRARNLAIENSSGNYLAFLDADDLWHPEKLQKQLDCIKKKSVDLVFSDCFVFQNNMHEISGQMNTIKGIIKNGEGLKLFFDVNQIPIATVLVKRDIVNTVGNFIEDISVQNAEDYNLWMKLLLNGAVFFGMEEPLSYYRIHENQNTKQDSRVPMQSINAIRILNIKDNNTQSLRRKYLLKWYRYLLFNSEIKDKSQYKNILKSYLEDTGRFFQYVILIAVLEITGIGHSLSIFKKYFI